MRLPLILASASPRRRGLLAALGVEVDAVHPADIDERLPPGRAPLAHAQALAAEKAAAVALALGQPALVLAADTVVHRDGVLYDKPADRAAARAALEALAGGWHEVSTAWELRRAGPGPAWRRAGVVTTRVRFRPLSAAAIEAYLHTGEGLDKAGAYAIQGMGAALVAELDGDLSAVVGLPLDPVLAALAEHHHD
ncbi:MAG: septum formation protein Maf [Deltaproteobacteria bacterium]|jgi:septum formation protein|nr:septum formation protein Maf [Deltaproteobacteria bacterium]